MHFLLICLLISCSNFHFEKNSKMEEEAMSIEDLTFEEYSIQIHNNTLERLKLKYFIAEIDEGLNFEITEEEFFVKMIEFKEQAESDAEKFVLYNWLLFNCLDKKSSYRLKIVDFIKENGFKYVTDGEEGYNLLHIAVFFKDPEMFKKYFNEKDLYSTGSRENSPRCNPILSLFLLNYKKEAKILDFLNNLYSCLNKEQIEKLGILQLACRFGMCNIVDYLVKKGINTESRLKIEIPPIESSIHTEEQLNTIKNHNLSISGYGVAFNFASCFINKDMESDLFSIMLSSKITMKNEGDIEWNFLSEPDSNSCKTANSFSLPYLFLQNNLRIQILNIINEPKKDFKDIVTIIANIQKHFNPPSDPVVKEKEENVVGHFLNLTLFNKEEYDEEEFDENFVMKDLFKKTLIIKVEDISLKKELSSINEIVKDTDIDSESKIKMVYKFMNDVCDFLNEESLNKNMDVFKQIFRTEQKNVLELIKNGRFGAARILIRFPDKFGIEKNITFDKREKNKGIKRVKETWLDKIIALNQEEGINKEELEDTISLARDKGWMDIEERVEMLAFKKRSRERKKGKKFKELQEYTEAQKKQEQDKRKKELEDKQKGGVKRSKETKIEEKASFDYIEERINYFELDGEETNKIFEELVMSGEKEKLVVFMNQVENKIHKSFKVVKAKYENIRQSLIIRGFVVNKELVLSMLENNQKKAMKTLLREITEKVRGKIFNFSEEERKIEITKEMKEIIGEYGKEFKVIKEERLKEENIAIKKPKFNKLFVHNKIIDVTDKDVDDNKNKEFYFVNEIIEKIGKLNRGEKVKDHDMKPRSFRNLRVSDKRIYYYREGNAMNILQYNENKNKNKETADFLDTIEKTKNNSNPENYTEIEGYFE